MSETFVDIDIDDAILIVAPHKDKPTVRFLASEDHGSLPLADMEFSRDDIVRMVAVLSEWIDETEPHAVSRGSDGPSASQNPIWGVWVAEGSGTDGRTTMSGWFRETPESLRLLEVEKRKLARAEARYECSRCGTHLQADYTLSDRLNRVRAFLWRQAHRLNCPTASGVGQGGEPS